MLEPGSRHLLLDALRPPVGYTLDLAVGTTFTLDLLSLMSTPVAFAMFDRQHTDGSPVQDPVALLQALREHASRITIFCQAGMIAVPPQFRSLLVYLEDSIHPVQSPDPHAIFHPKVWYIRFRRVDTNTMLYRLLSLSRNLTFDRSWDTVLRLDGILGDRVHRPELARFTESLVRMAEHTRPVNPKRAEAILEVGRQLSTVDWTLPDGFDDVRFWPLGDDGVPRWPFESLDWRRDQMLVISPFVTEHTLHRLTKRRKGSILVTRPETLDALGHRAVHHLNERLVLSPDTWLAAEEDAESETSQGPDGNTGPTAHRLEGLHAKTYVFDAGREAHVWMGSANATGAAFHGNVEFMVQLIGKKDRCGVQATIGDHNDRLGLRKIVEPYEPAQGDPLELTDEEKAQQHLESLQRTIGGLQFTAVCTSLDDDLWGIELAGVPGPTRTLPDDLQFIETVIRPVTLGPGVATRPSLDKAGLHAVFQVSEQAVTPFFALTLSSGEDEVSFVVAAKLVNPPDGRVEKVLTSLLRNRTDLIRLLLLLLGNIDDAFGYLDSGSGVGPTAGSWLTPFVSEALLEPLMRAFARDPERLHDIERLLSDLQHSTEEQSILPERWDEIWAPISSALAERYVDEH